MSSNASGSADASPPAPAGAGGGGGSGPPPPRALAVAAAAPNSEPRIVDPDEDTYVYRDFASLPAPAGGSSTVHPQSLQAQKLPAKLASMLSDPDMSSVIAWLPHGRSWRVVNREHFAELALPRYFGHTNHASFVRIVNAWGFRRITRGPDRDSYFHELFLRGRPDLHQRMKRLATCHRKTPINKEDKCPDFYELAKSSPLPEASYALSQPAAAAGGQMGGGTNMLLPDVNSSMATFSPSTAAAGPAQMQMQMQMQGPVAAMASNLNGQMLSLLAGAGGNGHHHPTTSAAMNGATTNVVHHPPPATGMDGGGSSNLQNHQHPAALSRLAQLQRDNEELRRKIMDLERGKKLSDGSGTANAAGCGGGGGGGPVAGGPGPGGAPAPGGAAAAAGMLDQELERMSRDFVLSGAAPANPAMHPPPVGGVGGGGSNDFSSFVGGGGGGFPRQEMLLRAMHLENSMGMMQHHPFHGHAQAATSAQHSSILERALQQQANGLSGGTTSAGGGSGAGGGGGMGGGGGAHAGVGQVSGEEQRKAMMDWFAKQQQQPSNEKEL
ncbi:hypothetical protein ACHAWF_007886 [Thalassiosira exigua]